MPPKPNSWVLVNFRADKETLAALEKITAALKPVDGELNLNSALSRSRAIRKAIKDAAARVEKD